MISFLADEDFNGRIVRGLLLRSPEIDLVRVQDIQLSGAHDLQILRSAEDDRRIVLTHDKRSMPRHFREHLARYSHAPGVVIVDDLASIGNCIEDVLLIAICSEADEWQDRIVYVPLK
jgi:predicted nuclease of predicted toxin-antitoxin system